MAGLRLGLLSSVAVIEVPAIRISFTVSLVDEEDGIFARDFVEEVHHELFLAGPGVDEEEVDLVGIESVVGGSGVDSGTSRGGGLRGEEVLASDAFAFFITFGEVAGA